MTYPAIVDSEEPIVRVIKTPQHYKNGKPKIQAFKPRSGASIISVVRWLYREQGTAFKIRCQNIGNVGDNSYWGLAVIRAAIVTSLGIRIDDMPEDYPGHAHFVFPISNVPENEPLQDAEFVRMNEILNLLINQSRFIEDMQPSDPNWLIPDTEFTEID